MQKKSVNKQYNVAEPQSLPVRIAAYQRRRMYQKFLEDTNITSENTILDIGVTADRTYEASNYMEAWYPHKDKITAAGIDDASFLEEIYPGMSFIQANGLDLPFQDGEFDYVHSSAVMEHVGSYENQTQFLRECCRTANKGIFLTTPNRWFPVEFHTVLPLVHWLPKPTFRKILNKTGHSFFAKEENLNLLSSGELKKMCQTIEEFDFQVSSVLLVGYPSNLIIHGRRK